MRIALRATLLLVGMSFGLSAMADEGMWTFDNFPVAKMRAKYGWAPAWRRAARQAWYRPTDW